MFGLIKKKDLAAFAERVHNDNALDARMDVPMKPVSYEDHKKAAYYSGYVDGSRALLFALRAFMFGGRKKQRRKGGGASRTSPPTRVASGGSVGASICREFETIVTVQIHGIDKNVELPADFDINKHKRSIEAHVCRVLREPLFEDANVNVKVQVFMKEKRDE